GRSKGDSGFFNREKGPFPSNAYKSVTSLWENLDKVVTITKWMVGTRRIEPSDLPSPQDAAFSFVPPHFCHQKARRLETTVCTSSIQFTFVPL
ncbi:MAG: hypothetical protein ACLS8R_03675, partial [Anaeromassilibacillus sp.]